MGAKLGKIHKKEYFCHRKSPKREKK